MLEHLKTFKRNRYHSLIFPICLIIIVFSFSLFSSSKATISLDFDETNMTICHPSDISSSILIEYKNIISVNNVHDLNVGSYISGTNTDEIRFGVWCNNTYGEYTLCCSPQISNYIALETVDGIIVFNYTDTSTTDELYSILLDFLKDRKT